jgi:hypothetical protein
MSFQIPSPYKNHVVLEGVDSTMIYCKNFCKCHNVPPVQEKNFKIMLSFYWPVYYVRTNILYML